MSLSKCKFGYVSACNFTKSHSHVLAHDRIGKSNGKDVRVSVFLELFLYTDQDSSAQVPTETEPLAMFHHISHREKPSTKGTLYLTNIMNTATMIVVRHHRKGGFITIQPCQKPCFSRGFQESLLLYKYLQNPTGYLTLHP